MFLVCYSIPTVFVFYGSVFYYLIITVVTRRFLVFIRQVGSHFRKTKIDLVVGWGVFSLLLCAFSIGASVVCSFVFLALFIFNRCNNTKNPHHTIGPVTISFIGVSGIFFSSSAFSDYITNLRRVLFFFVLWYSSLAYRNAFRSLAVYV